MKTDLLVIRERFFLNYAGMAELADAPDLGSGVHDVQVQVLLPAVEQETERRIRREVFGFYGRFRE